MKQTFHRRQRHVSVCKWTCRHISGIGDKMAKKIVERRLSSGSFICRAQLLSIAGLGPKTFEQAAGFLRIMPRPNSSAADWYVRCPSSVCLSSEVLFLLSLSSLSVLSSLVIVSIIGTACMRINADQGPCNHPEITTCPIRKKVKVVTVGCLSVCLSVPSFDCSSSVQWVCC